MENNAVLFNTQDVFVLTDEIIKELKERARNNPRKIARVCLHKNTEDSLHQMIIVLYKEANIVPHKHPNKIESFHIIEGSLGVLIYDEEGKITDKYILGDGGENLVVRVDKNVWHSVVAITDVVVFHEITNGPFTGIDDSVFSNW